MSLAGYIIDRKC